MAAVASSAGMAHNDSLIIISSSPEFPSICDLLPKGPTRSAQRSGTCSNAALISEIAPKAVTPAASVWKSSHRVDKARNGGLRTLSPIAAEPVEPPVIPTVDLLHEFPTESGSRGLRAENEKPRPKPTRTRKTAQATSRNATDDPAMDALPVDVPLPRKPGRKARSGKDGAVTQTTLPKGKVTKPASKEATVKKKAELVSKHFTIRDSTPGPASNPISARIEDAPMGLEPAMVRRLDWTPPRETAPAHQNVASSTAQEHPPSAAAEAAQGRGTVFGDLHNAYGRREYISLHTSNASISANPDILGKRKLVEMIATARANEQTPEVSPMKPKAPKKKPRTITELATAAYRQPNETDLPTVTEGPKQDSLRGYLETADGQTTAGAKNSRTRATAPKRLTKPKPPKKKKEVARKPILLSPTSAMREVAKQDFVFGTASQLATEDDPVLLRALHEAMQISNQADSDPFASPTPLNSDLAIRKRPGAGLWAAGARYVDGDLLDMAALDLTNSSPLLQDYVLPSNGRSREAAAVHRSPSQRVCIDIQSDDTFDLTELPPMADPKSPSPPARPHLGQGLPQFDDSDPFGDSDDWLPISTMAPGFEPPPSNQEQHQLLQSQASSPFQAPPNAPPRPSFELYTDARLVKEVTSYGFKAVKKRTAMIALLDQCWMGQNKIALGAKTTHASMSTATKQATSPARPRGRPRKNSTTSASDATEVPRAGKRGAGKSVPAAETGTEAPQAVKRLRGRPRKDAIAPPKKAPTAKMPAPPNRALSPAKTKAPASPKRGQSPPKSAALLPATPKRRKAAAKPVVEIADSDSDDPFTSSPVSSPDRQDMFSSPEQMDLSVTEDHETSLIASPTNQQMALFGYITQAVIGAPPSKDPLDPSWHEKMLMYDPIILEDLAAWLNSGQLDRAGYDKEVSPGDVKKWCESKSVCCLWRVNLNGKERKRF
ncbi:hypothetical protein BT67DRAFT_440777 [Trichocladium antarcticum]|uniref:Structure-specific endonuclease subunit SLX4 n=1 Tax=Trichocladium antarcticum TaxID=1450529 RepID=A0AAN6UMQ6_9PEZI|nr:hypothetical protein BT67DRAFT_440777 [Trichocladium antarcticum]